MINKERLNSVLLVFVSIIFTFFLCEIILRVKHSLIPNYDIEMWKYAKELKISVEDKKISHVHRPNKTSILQKVEISTNRYGQRDIEYDNNFLEKYNRRFLIIGSSIPLGWGVKKEETYANLLNIKSEENKKNWIFINGGVGNYNLERYTNNYLKNWSNLDFTDIIISYFVNDAEILENKKTNFFIKHTHLGVVSWKLFNSFKSSLQKENLDQYYKKIYEDDFEGFILLNNELTKLNNYCNNNNIKCHLINMPDIHQLNPYKLKFINNKIYKLTNDINMKYLDLLPIFENLDEKLLWNKHKDPHPNNYAHKLISDKIFQYLDK
tara:strand:- start:4235 stop:5203 length:969 start_codon:yes stop_codon:yes gene_type:complete